eukprot:GFUD01028628.1.p1 GENE.GFUD01028628.1~~GFUD01028628.1.p1  ORF type:complete len:768 (-),score=174.78 GFUD01028628.1:85-2388(-)
MDQLKICLETSLARSPSALCQLCTALLPDLSALSSHLQSYHPSDTFRCVACLGRVALFSSYTAARQHSVLVHQVSLDQAIQSSILLPRTLQAFLCKLCAEGRERIFLTEEAVQLHLGKHSLFFTKRWKNNSERICRICEDSLGEIPIESHLEEKHPKESFADCNDVEEDIEPFGDEMASQARKGKSHSKPVLVDYEDEDEPEVSYNKGSSERSGLVSDLTRLWDNSFKPNHLVSTKKSKASKSQKKLIPNVTKSDEDNNNNLCKVVSDTIKKEIVAEELIIANTHISPTKTKLEEKSSNLSAIKIKVKEEKSEKPRVAVESGNFSRAKDDDPSPEPTNATEYSFTVKSKYESAVIPLPCISHPSHSPNLHPMFYSCNVCPGSTPTYYLHPWARHRESEDHRYAYGKAFILNNFTHFPDATLSPDPATLTCLSCSKCSSVFIQRWDLNLHYRRTHLKNISYPITEPYCHPCGMQLMTYPGAPAHTYTHQLLMSKSCACRMCDMRVYWDFLSKHNEEAHGDQMFQCKLGQCGTAREGDRLYLFDFALHLYPEKLLQHQARTHTSTSAGEVLTTASCYFPASLVKISCRKCSYHVLGEDCNLMIHHLKITHNLDRRNFISFSCRVCGLFYYTIPDVIEHAKIHRERTTSDVASTCGEQQASRDRRGKDLRDSPGRSRSVKSSGKEHRNRSGTSSGSSEDDISWAHRWYRKKKLKSYQFVSHKRKGSRYSRQRSRSYSSRSGHDRHGRRSKNLDVSPRSRSRSRRRSSSRS